MNTRSATRANADQKNQSPLSPISPSNITAKPARKASTTTAVAAPSTKGAKQAVKRSSNTSTTAKNSKKRRLANGSAPFVIIDRFPRHDGDVNLDQSFTEEEPEENDFKNPCLLVPGNASVPISILADIDEKLCVGTLMNCSASDAVIQSAEESMERVPRNEYDTIQDESFIEKTILEDIDERPMIDLDATLPLIDPHYEENSSLREENALLKQQNTHLQRQIEELEKKVEALKASNARPSATNGPMMQSRPKLHFNGQSIPEGSKIGHAKTVGRAGEIIQGLDDVRGISNAAASLEVSAAEFRNVDDQGIAQTRTIRTKVETVEITEEMDINQLRNRGFEIVEGSEENDIIYIDPPTEDVGMAGEKTVPIIEEIE